MFSAWKFVFKCIGEANERFEHVVVPAVFELDGGLAEDVNQIRSVERTARRL